MDQWKTGYVVSCGTKLHYYRTGGSKQPLVLLHGITDDGLCWTPVAKVLANDYDVIMVDLRGHGKSEAPDQGYSYETMANEVAGLLNGLEVESPIVIGHSMGGMILVNPCQSSPRVTTNHRSGGPTCFLACPSTYARRAQESSWNGYVVPIFET